MDCLVKNQQIKTDPDYDYCGHKINNSEKASRNQSVQRDDSSIHLESDIIYDPYKTDKKLIQSSKKIGGQAMAQIEREFHNSIENLMI